MKLGKKKGTGYFSKCLSNVQEAFAGAWRADFCVTSPRRSPLYIDPSTSPWTGSIQKSRMLRFLKGARICLPSSLKLPLIRN